MKTLNSLTQKLRWILLIFFVGVSCGCAAQTKTVGNTQRKVLSDLCQDLKISNITYKPDTQSGGLGVFEDIVGKYFDKAEMKKNFEKDTSYYDTVTKFLFVQNYLRILHDYCKYIPAASLKLVDYAQSKHLDSSWQKGDKNEIQSIKNSYVLVYGDATKEFELMIIYFNPKNNRIIYLSERSPSLEDLYYLNDIIKGNRKEK